MFFTAFDNCTNTEILQLKPLIVDISVIVIKVNFCNYIKKNSKYIQQLIKMLRNKANEHLKKKKEKIIILYQDKKYSKLGSDYSKIIIEVCFISGIFYFNLMANKTE